MSVFGTSSRILPTRGGAAAREGRAGRRAALALALGAAGALALATGTGCAFRAGVAQGRAALDRGRPDDALRILADIELERSGRGAGVLARYDYVRGAALYEVGRNDDAMSALHAARAEDLRAGGALRGDDRVRLAKMLGELDTVAAGEPTDAAKKKDAAKAVEPPAKEAKDAKDAKDGKDGKDDKDDKDGKDGKGGADPKGAKAALPVAIACSGAVNTPTGIYGGYLVALNAKDAPCVLAHTTKAFAEKYGDMLEFAIGLVASAEGKVLEEKIDGAAATLKVHEKIVLSVDGVDSTSESDKTLKLTIEDGTWKLEALDEGGSDDGDDDAGDDRGDDDYPDDPGDGDDGDDGDG
ncbi:MAG TPA: hypothetical protein VG389_23130 [Myxococcota bacterium]|nr:hypothetical protein [Myxococcota bacterium]